MQILKDTVQASLRWPASIETFCDVNEPVHHPKEDLNNLAVRQQSWLQRLLLCVRSWWQDSRYVENWIDVLLKQSGFPVARLREEEKPWRIPPGPRVNSAALYRYVRLRIPVIVYLSSMYIYTITQLHRHMRGIFMRFTDLKSETLNLRVSRKFKQALKGF